MLPDNNVYSTARDEYFEKWDMLEFWFFFNTLKKRNKCESHCKVKAEV